MFNRNTDDNGPDTARTSRFTHWRRTLLTIMVTGLLVAPVAVWAADGFDDVPSSNIFHDDINWMADAGVTLGCNPPDNTEFCPDDNVTREQMAAFMHRLADNQVVDAGAIGGTDADEVLASETGGHAYVWGCDPTNKTYDPAAVCDSGNNVDTTYTFNSSGEGVHIARTTPGEYVVTFEGLGTQDARYGGGHHQVTAYDDGPVSCNVADWDTQGGARVGNGDYTVTVKCYEAGGGSVDAEFGLRFIW